MSEPLSHRALSPSSLFLSSSLVGWAAPPPLTEQLSTDWRRWRSTGRYHSTGGYLTVQEAPWRTPLATAFVSAGVEMGYDNIDFNAHQQTGKLPRTVHSCLKQE